MTADEIIEQLDFIDAEIDRALTLDKKSKGKIGVELHGKAHKVRVALDQLDPTEYEETYQRFAATTQRLMVDVFGLEIS